MSVSGTTTLDDMCDTFLYGAGEQDGLLRDESNLLAKPLRVILGERYAVHTDDSL
jgi:hypothetical protein